MEKIEDDQWVLSLTSFNRKLGNTLRADVDEKSSSMPVEDSSSKDTLFNKCIMHGVTVREGNAREYTPIFVVDRNHVLGANDEPLGGRGFNNRHHVRVHTAHFMNRDKPPEQSSLGSMESVRICCCCSGRQVGSCSLRNV